MFRFNRITHFGSSVSHVSAADVSIFSSYILVFHGAAIPWEHPELHAMGHNKSRLLLLIGSGPGLGRSVALCFAQQYFNRVALIARTAEQLQKNRIAVEGAAAAVGRKVIVQTWQLDVCDIELLEAALKEINLFGNLECVYYNAARVGLSPLFTATTETIEADWRVCLTANKVDRSR